MIDVKISNRDAIRGVLSAFARTVRTVTALELWRLSARCHGRGWAYLAFYEYHRGGQWIRLGGEVGRLATAVAPKAEDGGRA